MKKQIRHMLPEIEYICNLSSAEQNSHVKTIKKEFLKVLIDILLNVEKGALPVSQEVIQQLKPHKRLILSLIAKKTALKTRQNKLMKKGVFAKIFCPLLPVLRELVE